MNIEDVPFNRHIDVRRSADPEYLLEITPADHHRNHVGTVHAAVLLALAEGSAGDFLLQFVSADESIAVVTRSSARYSKPAAGVIRSRIETSADDVREAIRALGSRGRAMAEIEVSVDNEEGQTAARFTFTWLLSNRPPSG